MIDLKSSHSTDRKLPHPMKLAKTEKTEKPAFGIPAHR